MHAEDVGFVDALVEDGELFVWVKSGMTDLPDIEKYTGTRITLLLVDDSDLTALQVAMKGPSGCHARAAKAARAARARLKPTQRI